MGLDVGLPGGFFVGEAVGLAVVGDEVGRGGELVRVGAGIGAWVGAGAGSRGDGAALLDASGVGVGSPLTVTSGAGSHMITLGVAVRPSIGDGASPGLVGWTVADRDAVVGAGWLTTGPLNA